MRARHFRRAQACRVSARWRSALPAKFSEMDTGGHQSLFDGRPILEKLTAFVELERAIRADCS